MSVQAEHEIAHTRERRQTSREVWTSRFTRLAPLWTLLALIVFFSLQSPTFLRPVNLNNILVQASTVAIVATGMTFVLLTGEIDLSVAAIMGLSGMIAAQLFLNYGIPEPWATIFALAAATGLGFINGFVSTRFRIPTFMTTLAMQMIAEGLNQWISQGATIFKQSDLVNTVGAAKIGGEGSTFRLMTVMAVIIMVAAFLVLRYTRFGRYVYMTGASKSAARLAGVNTNTIIIACMVICAFLAGLAGIVDAGRIGSARPAMTGSYLIETIAAVVLGGTSLNGGRGGVSQTAIGALIYYTLRNGLDNIRSIDNFTKVFITGLVLLAALIINVVFSGKSERDRTQT